MRYVASKDLIKGGSLRNRAAALIVGILILGLLVAGCGDDDGGSTGAAGSENASGIDAGSADEDVASVDGVDSGGRNTDEDNEANKTIAKAEFIKRANAICEVTLKKITSEAFPVLEKAAKRSDSVQEGAETSLVSAVMVPGFQAEVEGIRALGAPPGDEDKVDAILDAIQEVVDKGEADPESFGQGTEPPYSHAARVAAAYGLASCPYG
jgi:hypothetical protein